MSKLQKKLLQFISTAIFVLEFVQVIAILENQQMGESICGCV